MKAKKPARRGKLARLLTSRKARCGAFGAVFSVLCAVFLIGLSAFTDYLDAKNGLRLDLSFNAIATKSDVTDAVLDQLTRDVRVYAVFSDGSEDVQLTELLSRYAARSPRFVWSRENLTRNPLLLALVSDAQDDAAVTSDCLIVRCEETDRTRVLTGEDYVQYTYNAAAGSYQPTGWTYEKSLSEAILYVTMDELPQVQILTGHGELSADNTALLEEKLIDANYAISRVNLLAGDTLDAGYPLMILSPLRDVTEEELASLTAYVQAGGDLFITNDYTDPDDLPNLRALYRLYGFEPLPGIVIADEAAAGTYYESVGNLLPEMLSTEVSGVLAASGYTVTLLAGARGFETPAGTGSNLTVETVLQSGETAYVRAYRDGAAGDTGALSIQKQAGDREGVIALSLVADRAFADGTRSRAFIIGNSSMFLDDWMYTYTYSGELLLQTMQYLQGKAPINLDIVPRTAAREQLNVVSSALPALLLAALPMAIVLIALCVLLPRKHL